MAIYRKLFIVAVLLLLPFGLRAQSTYYVGHACRSVEPGDRFFSLALQGYGHPAEGRFSIEWNCVGKLPVSEPLSVFGDSDNLFALALDGDLYREECGEWRNIGSTNPVVLLAGSDPNSFKLMASSHDLFYSISLLNGISSSKKSLPLSWEKHGKTPDAVAFTSTDNALYVATPDGSMLYSSVEGNSFEWKTFPAPPVKTISLAYFDGRIYALGENQQIWMTDAGPAPVWMKVAWLNGLTFKSPLKYIAVSDGKLFGFGYDGMLYCAHNRTENNLSVNAVAISDSKTDVIMVNLDSGAIGYSIVQRIKEEIFRETGVKPSNILFNITHTHFAPAAMDWIMFPGGIADRRYIDLVVRQSIDAAKEAFGSKEKARLTLVSGTTCVGYNRGLSGENAIVDRNIDMVIASPLSESDRLLMVQAACHPVFPNQDLSRFTLSANYPGALRSMLDNELKLKSVYFQGCCGDINPNSQDYRETARELATTVEAALAAGDGMVIKGKIRTVIDSVSIPVNVKSKEDVLEFLHDNENRALDIEAEKNVRWAKHMLDQYDSGEVPSTMTEYFQVIDIGDWRIVGLSREPVSSYAIGIRALWPERNVTVMGYCNDVSSYLPDDKHIETGTYESSDSFLWYGSPATFPSGTYDRILNKVKGSVKK